MVAKRLQRRHRNSFSQRRALPTTCSAERGSSCCRRVTSLVSNPEDPPVQFFSGVNVAGTVYRIGLALDSTDSRVCPGCAEPMDALGEHTLCCRPLGIYNRHNELRNEFALLCKDLFFRLSWRKGPRTPFCVRPMHWLGGSPCCN